MKSKLVHIGLVAGEASGDILGADLMKALKAELPDVRFSGIGGQRMIDLGFESLFPMDRLSVMGIVEPLKRLPELLRIRRGLRQHFTEVSVDLMVGIDSPDFNLSLEMALRHQGIPTAHYVSPSVWAWRRRRVFKIARAVDRMLTLFPFETEFYEAHQVPVSFVGHPLADEIPQHDQRHEARETLGLGSEPVVCLMPGSRGGEVAMLAGPFLDTALWLQERLPEVQFLLPAANAQRSDQIAALMAQREANPQLKILDGQSREAMAAADVVLMASGTATLEAMLLGRPMVACYRFGWWSYQLFSRLVKTPYFALPNLLAGRELVPERVQDDVCAEVLGPLLLERLQNPELRNALQQAFSEIHSELRCSAGQRAAAALIPLLSRARA